MKNFKLFLSLFLLSFQARSDFFIQWQNNNFITFDGTASSYFLPNNGDQARFELWHAGTDAEIDSEYNSDGTTNGDDVLLDFFVYTNSGSNSNERYAVDGNQPPVYSGAYLNNGEVFMRIIQGPSVSLGANYINGNLFSANNLDSLAQPAPPPDSVFMEQGNSIYIFDTQSNQIIPEPTTLMALLVGIVGLVGFRRHLLKK